MSLKNYNNSKVFEIRNELNKRKISFDEEEYSCLLTTNSITIDSNIYDKLKKDGIEIWNWLKTTLKIYNSSVLDKTSNLFKYFEWGLTPKAIEYQRKSSEKLDLPYLGRLDSVVLEPCQKIAEVQWKGGGEGFISEIQEVFNLFSEDDKNISINKLSEGLGNVFRTAVNSQSTINVLNTGRQIWMKTERGLKEKLKKVDINLHSLPPEAVSSKITINKNDVFLNEDGKLYKLDYIYMDRLQEYLSNCQFEQIVKLYWEEKIVLDPPPSYIFNQKISLALPFSDEFKELYNDSIREILIPTALVTKDKLDLKNLIPYMNHKNRDLLASVEKIEDLCKLPNKLRANLVVKCASSHKYNCHGGHAVWRLWGTKINVEKQIETINEMVKNGEPWIIQPYISQTDQIDFVHPNNVDIIQSLNSHARYGIYYGVINRYPNLIGAIATLSPFWKVAGKSASYDSNGNLFGSAFTNILIKE